MCDMWGGVYPVYMILPHFLYLMYASVCAAGGEERRGEERRGEQSREE